MFLKNKSITKTYLDPPPNVKNVALFFEDFPNTEIKQINFRERWGHPNPNRAKFVDILRQIQQGGAAMNFFWPFDNSDQVLDQNLQQIGGVQTHGYRRRLVMMDHLRYCLLNVRNLNFKAS